MSVYELNTCVGVHVCVLVYNIFVFVLLLQINMTNRVYKVFNHGLDTGIYRHMPVGVDFSRLEIVSF